MPRRLFRSSRAAGPRRGFTLPEVLVSMAIFTMAAIVLAAAYIGILNGYDAAARMGTSDVDVAFARALVLAEPDREKLEQGGDFDAADGRRVHWSVEISPTTMPDLYQIVFTCAFSGGNQPVKGEPEQVVETFRVLRPTWAVEVAERDKLREAVKARIAEIQGKEAGAR
ncbi:prepilin-type N-terminal cleavage/methylation domain-containing protein [Opitutus sp. ER46]|uniref:PulJ/GspJ family protein n=1 Tax=Opitutus sp. ER46 TaxID=2161864 RepID=UPI000D3219D2|nr:prepilin-type N-terminal cleavage/methylation domain-containing protein [Opitutus sp. ER46]PTX91641.1 hypothetical protein DB354_17375 [Opitutus sp. ER46]